ncbi:DNA gyrase inhibitor [Haematobacter missouriensis]|uniref:DNA gyrase inhibitor YacG n=1 Tax=Haematobacter missouriensis TaxID=366616 RepID=A0A212AYE5_9RHOB|nr:DNA gyrase inhibitor YacG [Haematobacter missouriensis]KFI33164.1 DNA gyrase inhibitor [Haematobacter missouriensis]OWJ78636.1 DNA gyrase inhibitor YacG [Haematobacter missouriensis]OWJ86484.1 DNA gyrase inhibitor YacG [Haematobacter missouriensis]
MPCPICGKPAVEKYRPFCSRRCADIDLGKWLTGAYTIPATEEDAPDEDDLDTRSMADPKEIRH